MITDLDSMGNKSEVMPILVRLYDSQNIISLAKDKDPEARTELTSIVTSLLEMELSPREADLVADVLISLMRQVERDLCIALSERLSTLDTIPLRLALHIANDTIEVASPVLKKSKVFNDLDLIYIIKSKTSDYWSAIASREDLSNQVMDMLADTEDFDTALALVKNENIILTDHTLNKMVDLAQESDEIAGPLLHRDEVTADIVKTLFRCVGMALKDHIRQEFEINDDDVIGAVDDVVIEFVEAVDQAPEGQKDHTHQGVLPAESHIKVARTFKAREALTLQIMLKTLKRGQYKSFVAQFATYMDLDTKTVSEVLLQKSGQGLAIICKAESIQRNDFVSIYLLVSRMRNKGGMVDGKDLSRATQYYDRIDPTIAKELLESSRKYKTSIVPKE